MLFNNMLSKALVIVFSELYEGITIDNNFPIFSKLLIINVK